MWEETLSSCTFCGLSESTTNFFSNDEAIQKLMRQIGSQCPSFLTASVEEPFCADCFSCVAKAVEWGEQVSELDQDVKNLQRILLKLTQQLTTLQEIYLGEMKKLETKIKASEENLTKSNRMNSTASSIRKGVCNVVKELLGWQQLQIQPCFDKLAVTHPENEKIAETASTLSPTVPEVQNTSPMSSNTGSGSMETIDLFNALDIVAPLSFPVAVEAPEQTFVNVGTISVLSASTAEPLEDSWTILSLDAPLASKNSAVKTPNHVSDATSKIEEIGTPDNVEFATRYTATVIPSNKVKPFAVQHDEKNNNNGPYTCPICCKAFRRFANLRRHKLCHESRRKDFFECPDCFKGFVREDVYEVHRRIHTGEDIFT